MKAFIAVVLTLVASTSVSAQFPARFPVGEAQVRTYLTNKAQYVYASIDKMIDGTGLSTPLKMDRKFAVDPSKSLGEIVAGIYQVLTQEALTYDPSWTFNIGATFVDGPEWDALDGFQASNKFALRKVGDKYVVPSSATNVNIVYDLVPFRCTNIDSVVIETSSHSGDWVLSSKDPYYISGVGVVEKGFYLASWILEDRLDDEVVTITVVDKAGNSRVYGTDGEPVLPPIQLAISLGGKTGPLPAAIVPSVVVTVTAGTNEVVEVLGSTDLINWSLVGNTKVTNGTGTLTIVNPEPYRFFKGRYQ